MKRARGSSSSSSRGRGAARASFPALLAVLLAVAAAGGRGAHGAGLLESLLASSGAARLLRAADAPAPAPAPAPAQVPAKCVSPCPAVYEPVCGADARTYANACSAACRGVAVASRSVCASSGSSSGSSSSSSGGTERGRKPGCVCAAAYDPVCGADGRSYASACEADCERAAVAHRGVCRPAGAAQGGSGSSSGSSSSSSSKPPPASTTTAGGGGGIDDVVAGGGGGCVCPAVWAPVCTTRGETRGSKCDASCRGEAVAYSGACRPGGAGGAQAPPLVTTEAGPRAGGQQQPAGRGATVAASAPARPVMSELAGSSGSSAAADDQAATARAQQAPASSSPAPAAAAAAPAAAAPAKPPRRADCVCAALYAPVCGADGQTYSNRCEAGCHGVTPVRDGGCSSAPPLSVVPADGDNVADPIATTRPVGSCDVCPAVYKPVCGADGKTYPSDCDATCRGRTTVARAGPCSAPATAAPPGGGGSSGPTTTPPPTTSTTTKPRDAAEECAALCPTGPDADKPVCGTDNKQYRNKCDAECHATFVAYPGRCRAECAACPTALKRYCVNDAAYGPRTFANCCYAKCSGVDVVARVLHQGSCEPKCLDKCDAGLERPLCCQGRTYKNGCFATCVGEDTNKCSAGRCSSVADVGSGLGCLLGPCAVKCDGYRYDDPVCGSDGRTYPSRCHLLCDQKVAVVASGKCGACPPGSKGVFPFCAPGDAGIAPVCAAGTTYRNAAAARAAGVGAASAGACPKACGEKAEVCYQNSAAGGASTCCGGLTCKPDGGASSGSGGSSGGASKSLGLRGTCVAPSGGGSSSGSSG